MLHLSLVLNEDILIHVVYITIILWYLVDSAFRTKWEIEPAIEYSGNEIKLILPFFLSRNVSFFVLFSHHVVFNSLQPHKLEPTRLHCPSDFPSKNTDMTCHFLFQGIFSGPGIKLTSPFWSKDWTHSPALQADFYRWATREHIYPGVILQLQICEGHFKAWPCALS